MKVRITKIKGGALPDGAWIIGEGNRPSLTYNYFLAPIDAACESLKKEKQMQWFVTQDVMKIIETDYGYLFVAGAALWKWQCMVFDHGIWIPD